MYIAAASTWSPTASGVDQPVDGRGIEGRPCGVFAVMTLGLT